MSDDGENTLIGHLEDLRSSLLKIIYAIIILYPVAYYFSSDAIELLIKWCFKDTSVQLHYFAPMEVFWQQLQLSLILALAIAYPWSVMQIWNFLLPALYKEERKALGSWIIISTLLFFGGIIFSVGFILPLMMKFSIGFSSESIKATIGLANFLNLSGWLSLAFGVMFQAPIIVLLIVRFGLVSSNTLAYCRPYVMTVILIISAVLTPPDVVSQVMLAVPTWLLFEIGLMAARKIEIKSKNDEVKQE